MNDKDYKLFCSIATKTQEQLQAYLQLLLMRIYSKRNVRFTKDYIYAAGRIPVALVAHMDTVHPTLPKEIFHDQQFDVIWSPQGLGADDRAGVFAIIKILQTGLRPTIIFTTDEEYGALGADMMLMDIKKPVPNVNYLLEIDYHGSGLCTFYGCPNKTFTKYIKKFGWLPQEGLFSDISFLSPGWDIAGVNVSAGYYNEHKLIEYLNINELYSTIDTIQNMLRDENIPYFRYWTKE